MIGGKSIWVDGSRRASAETMSRPESQTPTSFSLRCVITSLKRSNCVTTRLKRSRRMVTAALPSSRFEAFFRLAEPLDVSVHHLPQESSPACQEGFNAHLRIRHQSGGRQHRFLEDERFHAGEALSGARGLPARASTRNMAKRTWLLTLRTTRSCCRDGPPSRHGTTASPALSGGRAARSGTLAHGNQARGPRPLWPARPEPRPEVGSRAEPARGILTAFPARRTKFTAASNSRFLRFRFEPEQSASPGGKLSPSFARWARRNIPRWRSRR